jgi:hypothetical protein
MSPASTVASAITSSNAAPLNAPCDCATVVLVGGGAVVVVVDASVVVVSATGLEVEVEAIEVVVVGVNRAGALVDVVSSTVVVSGVETDLAAVSFDEQELRASATTATPKRPIVQTRLAMAPFSPLGSPNRRHDADC